VQVYVSNLRKALGGGVLTTRGRGYELCLERLDIDALRFQTLAATGRRLLETNDAAGAREALDAALGLWRGRPLEDFRYERFAQGEIARLEEARLVAIEQCVDARLALGEHAEPVGELELLVRDEPLRERPRAQLMLAGSGTRRRPRSLCWALPSHRQTPRRLRGYTARPRRSGGGSTSSSIPWNRSCATTTSRD
jgi:DNA-binding SARP family transcriptional activator